MKVLFVLALLATNAAFADPPKPRPKEIRRHWASVRSDGTHLYDVTTITDISEPVTGSVVIARDRKGERWMIESQLDLERGAAWTQITMLATGEYFRASHKMPKNATFATPEILTYDPDITLQTRTASRTALESEWEDLAKSEEIRTDIRVSLSTAFLDGIERMGATLFPHDSEFGSIASFVQSLSHAPACEVKPYSKEAELEPDCKFDKEFGFPCSSAQEERIEKARKKGTLRSTYF